MCQTKISNKNKLSLAHVLVLFPQKPYSLIFFGTHCIFCITWLKSARHLNKCSSIN